MTFLGESCICILSSWTFRKLQNMRNCYNMRLFLDNLVNYVVWSKSLESSANEVILQIFWTVKHIADLKTYNNHWKTGL